MTRIKKSSDSIYDNALPNQLFNKIITTLDSGNFPWFYSDSAAYDNSKSGELFTGNYYHNALIDGAYNSAIGPLLESVLLSLVDLAGEELKAVDRIRLACINVAPTTKLHEPHVDMDIEHRTALLYLNDSDGDTYIYNEKFIPNIGTNSYEQYLKLKNKFTISQQITPKANRFVPFNGLQYHNSSTPTKTNRRLVINFNYYVK